MIDSLRRNPLLLALAFVAAALAVVLALELRLGAPASRDAAPKGARPVEAKLLPPIASRPPEQAYPEVTNRPLFVATRRPSPEVAVAQAPTMQRGQYVLQGVIVHGQQRTALLRERSSGRVHRADAGQEVNGIKVVKIEPEAVTLGLNGEREVLSLIVQKAGGPAAAGPLAAMPPSAAAGGAGGGPFAAMPPAGQSPFARPNTPMSPEAMAQAAAARAGAPVAIPAPGGMTPQAPGTPGFGPAATQPGSTPNVPTPPVSQPAPQAGPAFPMSPEELLARRRARRAQQNQ